MRRAGELALRLDVLEGRAGDDGAPLAVLFLPPNGRDVLGGGAQIFDPARCAALEAAGVDHLEAMKRSVMTDDEILAHNAAVAAGDPAHDVGDSPPVFDDGAAR